MVETEMRAIVNNGFLKTLKKKYQLSEVKTYGPCTDDYYKPIDALLKDFDPNNVTLRTRKNESDKETSIVLDKTSYENGLKKSVYGGKIVLFKGPENIVKDILKTLNFEYWFSINKHGGKIYKVTDKKSDLSFNLCIEDIEGIGNTVEVEFKTEDSEADANKIIDMLNIEKKNMITKSMASFVAERLGLL